MLSANYDVIIQKIPHLFKCNISIDNACFHTYGTIILQVPQTKRVMTARFFEKN